MGKAPPRGRTTPTEPTMAQYLTQLFDAGLHVIPLEQHGKHTIEKDWNKRGETDIPGLFKRGARVWHSSESELIRAADNPLSAWMPTGFNYGVLNEHSGTVVIDMDDPLAVTALNAGLRHVGGPDVEALLALTDFKWLSPRGTKLMFARPRGVPGTTQRITRRVRTPDGRTQVQTVLEFRGSGQDVLPYSHRSDKAFTLKWAHPGGWLPPDATLPACPLPLADLLSKLARHDSALITVMQQAAGTDASLTGMDAVGDHDYPARLAACVSERTAVNGNLSVPDLLTTHGYREHGNRWSAPGSHHAAGIAPSKTDRGIWINYHESDPLSGRFDAWRAFVELEHGGDLEQARIAAKRYSALRLVKPDNRAIQVAGPDEKKPPATVADKQFSTEQKSERSLTEVETPAEPEESITHGLTLADLERIPITEQVIIEGFALARSLIYLGGAWSAGKTAMALAFGCGIASGLGNVLGQRCVTGTVVYFAVEDAPTVYLRARAWRRKMAPAWDGRNMLFYPALDLHDEDAVSEAMDRIREDCARLGIDPPVLIVIDTQAAATAGMDENSMQETTLVLDRINRMKAAMNCAMAIVHHHGKDDSKGLRGSSALSAAADSIIAFELDDTVVPAVQTAEVKKARGMMRRRAPLMSQVLVVDMGVVNNFGQPVTAMILVEAEKATLDKVAADDWLKAAHKGMREEHIAICELVDLMGGSESGVAVKDLKAAWRKRKPEERVDNLSRQVLSAVDKAIGTKRLVWVDPHHTIVRSGRPGVKDARF